MESGLITGSFEKDILCLIEGDILGEIVSVNTKVNRMIRSIMLEHVHKSPEERLLVKFQAYMLLQRDYDLCTVLHQACLQGSHLIPFLVEQATRLGIMGYLVREVDD